jgi:DNA invertase Pin-like site-specific DNA recombinase
MERVVAYLRVSTQRQQRSGLGIEAQRTAIEQFGASESLAIVSEFVEFESGEGADALDRRPQLAAALAAAKASKCSVVVAKLAVHFPARRIRGWRKCEVPRCLLG